jgi:hypothetical protein
LAPIQEVGLYNDDNYIWTEVCFGNSWLNSSSEESISYGSYLYANQIHGKIGDIKQYALHTCIEVCVLVFVVLQGKNKLTTRVSSAYPYLKHSKYQF